MVPVGRSRMSKNQIAKFHLSETLVSLERTADSISMLNLAENSEVSILIPHSVTALDTMVST
jgi:hypothetical protein